MKLICVNMYFTTSCETTVIRVNFSSHILNIGYFNFCQYLCAVFHNFMENSFQNCFLNQIFIYSTELNGVCIPVQYINILFPSISSKNIKICFYSNSTDSINTLKISIFSFTFITHSYLHLLKNLYPILIMNVGHCLLL